MKIPIPSFYLQQEITPYPNDAKLLLTTFPERLRKTNALEISSLEISRHPK